MDFFNQTEEENTFKVEAIPRFMRADTVPGSFPQQVHLRAVFGSEQTIIESTMFARLVAAKMVIRYESAVDEPIYVRFQNMGAIRSFLRKAA